MTRAEELASVTGAEEPGERDPSGGADERDRRNPADVTDGARLRQRGRMEVSLPHTAMRYREVYSGVHVVSVM